MKLYELNYVVSPELSAEQQKNLSEKVVVLLETQPIQQSSSGFLNSLDFYSNPEKIKNIETNLKAEPGIKRLMIVKKSLPKLKARISRRTPLAKKPEKKTDKPKVELKEIEKKLDEILKE
jgi:ribosomal protein S6